MDFKSLLHAAVKFQDVSHQIGKSESKIIARGCVMIQTEAKRVIGTYEYGWPTLAPSTLEKKSADTPLLETGGLRDSIEWNASEHEGRVGTNDDKAVWQELGTSRIPPRSFLVGAAVREEPKIHAMAAREVMLSFKR